MTVVAHHPVVVETEGVALGYLAVDKDAACIVHFQVVALVNLDASFVDGQVVEGQGDGLALLWNPNRTIVVARPACIGIDRV